jgi:restriction endonuclease Mrr
MAISRTQQICEFLFDHPDSSIKEIETATSMSHHLAGVHLYRLKRSGFITNVIRGHYRVTDAGRALVMRRGTIQKVLMEENPQKADTTEGFKQKKQKSMYRVVIQGESFAHDELVEEELARKVIYYLLTNKKV